MIWIRIALVFMAVGIAGGWLAWLALLRVWWLTSTEYLTWLLVQ